MPKSCRKLEGACARVSKDEDGPAFASCFETHRGVRDVVEHACSLQAAMLLSMRAYATPARRRSWKCTTPTARPPSTTISCVFLVELSSSSASLTS
jgi:hypothetical protein